jgi:hypothetical protein
MDEFLIIFIIVLAYVLLLFIIRNLRIGSKKSCINCSNCCPDCSLALNRIRRLYKDKIAYQMTFRAFNFKRYICNECGWEGLRWEEKYTPQKKN